MPSKIDDNQEYVGLAIDGNGVVRPLLVDPTTGYLEVAVVFETSSETAGTRTPIDENFKEVDLVVENVAGTVRPLLVQPSSGALLVTIP
jgi:hypothetical protein